jgi:hypothetical protein
MLVGFRGSLRNLSNDRCGQGRLWPTGEWHSRSTPSSGNARAFPHSRFVPILLQKSVETGREA